ncbi:fructose-1,6-bisphosphatase [Candidatus Gracilibacteria bacterium]|nr:fructose-1,6-bisphosphatase [Candidatus Gracilibacteria bacterium]
MQFFNHFLREKGVSADIRSLLYHVARAVKYINFSLRAGNTQQLTTQNASGESQLKLDVLADQIITNELQKSELAHIIASEEQEKVRKFAAPRGKYGVSFDPLDGSSLVDTNLAIGSIFGIWDCGESFIGTTGRKNLVASCYAVYGPRVTFVIAIKNKGTHEFELNDVGEFTVTRENIQLKPDSKYFAPGNLRAGKGNARYLQLIQEWILEGRTLRYSGGMVPDLNHILCKEEGIFSYPHDQKYPQGKLRLLFECAPFAFLFAEAGGSALDQEGLPILDIKVKEIHQRTSIFIGSKNEVEKAIKILK